MMEAIIFYALAGMAVIPAVLVVTLKNVFHAALMLILSLLGVAGMYAMLAADFIFAVQLLVYAGGVMVILLFVILLSGKPSDWTGAQMNEKVWEAGLFSLFLVVVLGTLLYKWVLPIKSVDPIVTTAPLGKLLLSQMVIPFEAISLVLVAALIGAVYFSVKRSQ